MKRLICSAAVASALLAITAIPSGAAVLNISGASTEAATPYDDTYTFRLPTTETVDIIGGEMNIASFMLKGLPISYTFDPSTLPTGFNSFYSFDGVGTLGPGTYSLVVTGTGGKGATFPGSFSFYGGTITTSGAISPVPIPGTAVLFLTGLGLLGFWGWTKGRKSGLELAPPEAMA
jgi:hypothetical protein